MRIQYEPGDEVYFADDYGGHRYTVVAIRKNGLTVEDIDGQRLFAGKRQVEPAPLTVINARWIPQPATEGEACE